MADDTPLDIFCMRCGKVYDPWDIDQVTAHLHQADASEVLPPIAEHPTLMFVFRGREIVVSRNPIWPLDRLWIEVEGMPREPFGKLVPGMTRGAVKTAAIAWLRKKVKPKP
jgi:hypothetical protein